MREFDVKLTKDDIGLFMSGVVATRRVAVDARRKARDLKTRDYYDTSITKIDALLRKLESSMNPPGTPERDVFMLD